MLPALSLLILLLVGTRAGLAAVPEPTALGRVDGWELVSMESPDLGAVCVALRSSAEMRHVLVWVGQSDQWDWYIRLSDKRGLILRYPDPEVSPARAGPAAMTD